MKLDQAGMNKFLKICLISTLSSCAVVSENIKPFNKNNFFNFKKSTLIIFNTDIGSIKRTVLLNNNEYKPDTQIINTNKILLTFDAGRVVLLRGKIVNTFSQINNFSIINYTPFQELLFNNRLSSSALIKLTNPETHYMHIDFTYKKLGVKNKYLPFKNINIDNPLIVKESFNVPQIRWKGDNYYLLDTNGTIIKSYQILAP